MFGSFGALVIFKSDFFCFVFCLLCFVLFYFIFVFMFFHFSLWQLWQYISNKELISKPYAASLVTKCSCRIESKVPLVLYLMSNYNMSYMKYMNSYKQKQVQIATYLFQMLVVPL